MPETTQPKGVQYAHSIDGVNFSKEAFDSIEAAKADAVGKGYTHIHIGEVHHATNQMFYPDADVIIDHMLSAADDFAGEFSDSYPDAPQEACDELTAQLTALMDAWCKKHHIEANFSQMINVAEYDI